MCRYPVFLYHFWKGCFLHHMFLGSFVKNQMAVTEWIYVWAFYSVPWVMVSVFVPVPCCFLLLWLCSTVGSQVLWYLQYYSFCSVLPWLFEIYMNFRVDFSIFEEHQNFDGDGIQHIDCFWYHSHFHYINSADHELERTSHLL
jgi:hypothetical protein